MYNPLQPHVREHLLATVTPLSSPLLSECLYIPAHLVLFVSSFFFICRREVRVQPYPKQPTPLKVCTVWLYCTYVLYVHITVRQGLLCTRCSFCVVYHTHPNFQGMKLSTFTNFLNFHSVCSTDCPSVLAFVHS